MAALRQSVYRTLNVHPLTYNDLMEKIRFGKETVDDMIRRLAGLPPIKKNPRGNRTGFKAKRTKIKE